MTSDPEMAEERGGAADLDMISRRGRPEITTPCGSSCSPVDGAANSM